MLIDNVEALRASFERAANFLQAGDARMAEDVCRNALSAFPNDGNLLSLLAAALLRQRRPQEAEAPLRSALRLFPDFPRAHEELGNVLFAQRRVEEALAAFERTVELEPRNANARAGLGRCLAALGRNEEADAAFESSFRMTPQRQALAKAAERHRAGRLREAEKIYREVLRQDPHNVDALRLLAQIAIKGKQFGDAQALLQRAVEIAPDFHAAWNDLIRAFQEQDRYDEALGVIDRSLQLDPQRPHLHCLRGNTLAMAGRHEEAATAYEAALKINANHFGSLEGLGHVLKTIGRQQEAITAYRRSIKVNPTFGDAYWSMANLKTFQFADEEIEAMQGQLQNDSLADEPRTNFEFALGKAEEDRGNYAAAFAHYERGNSIRRRHEHYDPVETELIHDRLIDVFDGALIEQFEGLGDPSTAPIFIVGLPRSGSTLLEQILASHSQVEGTHELPELGRLIRGINESRKDHKHYPEALRDFDAAAFAALGKEYLERSARHRRGAPRFTDKMPNNFASIGLIHLILPNAKIIDARRHPLDSCFGSYKQLFAKGQPFTYDLMEIGEYYLQYRRLMRHWHAVLPGRVLEVRYEDTVADLEVQVRRILSYCELPFEDACLQFFDTERAVRTASSEQVRQPIYSDSVNAWQRFEPWLGPLIEVLDSGDAKRGHTRYE